MIPDQYRSLVYNFVEAAIKNAEDNRQLIPIVLLANTKENTQVPILAAFSDNEEKILFSEAIKKVSRSIKPDIVLSAFEANMTKIISEERIESSSTEVIVIQVETRKESWFCSCPISKNRKITKPDPLFKKSDMKGIFSNFIHLKSVLN